MTENISVREAGLRIQNAGLTDRVKKVDNLQDRTRGQGDVTDADDRTEKRAKTRDRDESRYPNREERRRRREEREERDARAAREAEAKDAGKRRQRDPEPDDADDDDETPIRSEYEYEDREDDREDAEDADDADPDTEDRGDSEDEDEDADEPAQQPREEKFTFRAAGETVTVDREELIRGYQRNRDYQQKTANVANLSKQLTSHHTKQAEIYRARVAQLTGALDGVKKLLVGDLNTPQMQELRARNAAEWTAVRMQQQDRIDHVDAVINNLLTERERHDAEYTQAQAHQRAATIQAELEMIQRYIPDWLEASEAGKPSAAQRVVQYLEETGFQPAEYQTVTDHRQLLLVHKAMLYDELMKRQKKPTREAKPVPRSAKPGKGHNAGYRTPQQAQQQRGQNSFRRAKEHAKRTGNARDAARAIEHLL